MKKDVLWGSYWLALRDGWKLVLDKWITLAELYKDERGWWQGRVVSGIPVFLHPRQSLHDMMKQAETEIKQRNGGR